MKKLSMRFCQRNIREEGSDEVVAEQSAANGHLLDIKVERCLGLCNVCNQGPMCTLNDFVFAEQEGISALNARLNGIFEQLTEQLKKRQASSETERGIEMSKAGLVIIDMQNDYCKPGGVFAEKAKFPIDSIQNMYANMQNLIDGCREQGIPVIWVKMIWDSDEEVGILAEKSHFLREEGLRRGTWGAEIVDELDVRPEDPVVEKKRFNAFFETNLDEVLEKLGVCQLIVAGVRTDFCVESTVRDAFFRDYEVFVPTDAVAGFFQELHESSLKVMNTVFAQVMSSEDILKQLK